MNVNAQKASEEIKKSFEELHVSLSLRDGELLGEVEATRLQKEKELKFSLFDLEMTLERFNASVSFTNALLNKGSPVEISKSSKDILGKTFTLII